jgi:hypothetical protein
MPVAHQPLATVIGQLVGMAGEQDCDLGLHRLRQQRSRAVAQNLGQRVRKSSWLASRKTLASVTAYHSFGGEVEASSTPTIRRLTPSCRHQLSLIALRAFAVCTIELEQIPVEFTHTRRA